MNTVDVAEAINAARIAANQNDDTASQSGVYGQLSSALKDTLYLLIGDWGRALDAYQFILDGSTVDQAVRSA